MDTRIIAPPRRQRFNNFDQVPSRPSRQVDGSADFRRSDSPTSGINSPVTRHDIKPRNLIAINQVAMMDFSLLFSYENLIGNSRVI